MHELSVVLASNNPHKVKEIREILFKGCKFLSLEEAGVRAELPETTGTIAGNALQKARAVWKITGLNCLADDSGLLVEALGSLPGVDSAHFAGLPPDPSRNNQKLLELMDGINDRRASFITVLALILDGEEFLFEGRVNGSIATSPRGNSGFGYDPLFIPEGSALTFAEMDEIEKNRISHRAKALEQLSLFLGQK